MRPICLLRLVPVACAYACGDATQPASSVLPPSLTITSWTAGDVPIGPAAFTDCVIEPSTWINYMAEPHFLPTDSGSVDSLPLPYAVFSDPVQPPDQCGDLDFNDSTRILRFYYATSPSLPDENPWKYWWRRSRRSVQGTSDLDALVKVKREAGVYGWDTVPVWLGEEYEAIGVVLVLNPDSMLAIDEAVFTEQSDEYGGINVVVQHWAHRDPPTFLSATPNGSNITLLWQNEHTGRAVDSTNIYRDGAYLITVGPADTSYVDTNLAFGTYSYSLKHISMTAANTSPMGRAPYPNSPSSDTILVTVNQPPHASFSVACQQLPCTFTHGSSDPDGTVASWLWTFGDGDSSTQQHPSHTYVEGGWYSVELVVTDNDGATDDTTLVAPPLQLGILGPTTVRPKVTCEWDAYPQGGSGGMVYSWEIGGQEVGSDESLYWYTGTSGFQITLLGQAGDGQADTAVVTVTLDKDAPSCVLKQGGGR